MNGNIRWWSLPASLILLFVFLAPTVPAGCPDSANPVTSMLGESIAPGGYEPVWDFDEFWLKAKMVGRAPIESRPRRVQLAMFIYYEENADEPENPRAFRTGCELELYRQIKEYVRTRSSGEMLTPAQIADLALYAVRDESGRANAQLAMLTAHNVIRLLARPKQWTFPGRPILEGDDLVHIVNDLKGESSVGGGKSLLQLMYDKGRLHLSPSRVRDGVVKPQPTADWSVALFSLEGPSKLFSTLPEAAGDEDNGGAHYYHWVGSLAQAVGGWPGGQGAITFEAFIKWSKGEGGKVIGARRPGYQMGVALSEALEAYSEDSLRALFHEFNQSEDGHLGLHPLTWRLITTRSGFIEDLRNNISKSLDYLTFHLELEKIARMDDWREQVAMLELLGLKDRSIYQLLLMELENDLPALAGKELQQLTVDEFLRLKNFLAQHVKWLIGPRTIFRCRVEFDPAPGTLDELTLEGKLALESLGRSETISGGRDFEFSLDLVDDLDRFIRGGASLALLLAGPLAFEGRKALTFDDFRCENGLLAAETVFTVPWEGSGKKQARMTVKRVNLVNKSKTVGDETSVRWEFDRLFEEHVGVGVTFYGAQVVGWRGDTQKMDQMDQLSFRVEPGGSYLHKGGHLAYSPLSSRDTRRGRLQCTYLGTDDNGNEVKVVDDIEK